MTKSNVSHHEAQIVLPAEGATKLTGHDKQPWLADSTENAPGRHAAQTDAPDAGIAVPEAHGEQDESPDAFAYIPAHVQVARGDMTVIMSHTA